jgi:hypothetical protein
VNGFDFRQNEFSYRNKLAGRVETVRVDGLKSGEVGRLRGLFRWLSPTGEAMLDENRSMEAEPLIEKNGGAIANSAGSCGMLET